MRSSASNKSQEREIQGKLNERDKERERQTMTAAAVRGTYRSKREMERNECEKLSCVTHQLPTPHKNKLK